MIEIDDNIVRDKKGKINYWYPRNQRPNPPLKMISLFTGGGGLDIGLEKAGFETVAYVEKDKYCQKTISENRPNWALVGDGDIITINAKKILEKANVKREEIALIAGGAPCQPFSSLGKNEGENVPNGQLYQRFIEIVSDIQPAMFLFENVRGMLQNHHKIVDFMNEQFDVLGYKTTTALICAADYGVPQKRYRLFIIGRRDDKDPGFPLPTHAKEKDKSQRYFSELFAKRYLEYPNVLKPWVTVKETFDQLTPLHYIRPDSKRANLAPEIRAMIRKIEPESTMNWKSLPEEYKFKCWKDSKFQGSDNFSRLQWNKPSVTIRTGAIYPAKGKYIHPKKNRGLYTIELAALQTFPLDLDGPNKWIFSGGITNVARQIGNAVPPILAEALGEALIEQAYEVMESQVMKEEITV